MVDFLLKYQKSSLQIRDFLADIFECPIDRIKVITLDELYYSTEKLDYSVLECMCVFFSAHGDAAQILQLYIYKISVSDTIDRIINIALKSKIHIYIQKDSL